jgi:hypothetical protein
MHPLWTKPPTIENLHAAGDSGGFVGAEQLIEDGFDLNADIVGGGDFPEHGALLGYGGMGFGAEEIEELGDGAVIFGRELGVAGAEAVDGGVARTSGFAFRGPVDRWALRRLAANFASEMIRACLAFRRLEDSVRAPRGGAGLR